MQQSVQVHLSYLNQDKQLNNQEKKATKAVKALLASKNELEMHWPEEATREKELVRVTSLPLLQTSLQTLRATGFFKSAFGCCQFVCVVYRVSIFI